MSISAESSSSIAAHPSGVGNDESSSSKLNATVSNGINDGNNNKTQKNTIDWGKTDTNTEIIFNTTADDTSRKLPEFLNDKSSGNSSSTLTNEFAKVDESRFQHEQALKRRKNHE